MPAKLIAIWGAPNTGKTTFAVQMAKMLSAKKQRVFLVLPDMETPQLGYIFPHRKADETFSLGEALSKTVLTQDDLYKVTVTTKAYPNLGYLGYKDRDTELAYVRADEDKCASALILLEGMADFVIVDCTSSINAMSRSALRIANISFRVVSPDLKCICYCGSRLQILTSPALQMSSQILVLNNNKGKKAAVDDAKAAFEKPGCVLPYSQAVADQYELGQMMDTLSDKKYKKAMDTVINRYLFQRSDAEYPPQKGTEAKQ